MAYASGSQYSFEVVPPDGISTQWNIARSPYVDSSPLESSLGDFSDNETGSFLNPLCDGSPTVTANEFSNNYSTALTHGLGNVDIGDRRDSDGSFFVPVTPGYSTPEPMSVLFRTVEPSMDNRRDGTRYTGSTNCPPMSEIKTEFIPDLGGGIRHNYDLSPIDTQCLSPGTLNVQPPSGFTDQSPINSTSTVDTSPSKSQRQLWAFSNPPTLNRKRSISTATRSPGGPPNRKRSLSDTRSYPTNVSSNQRNLSHSPLGLATPYTYLPESPFQMTVASHYDATYACRGHKAAPSPPSLDFSDASGRGAMSLGEHAQSPTFVYQGPQAPFQFTPEEAPAGPSTSTFGTHEGPIKKTVASDAVVNAAAKKRKPKPDGKMFPCYLCTATLTTKQNLQYHIAAHNGERNFGCRKCSKTFTTPHVRNRHEQRCKKGSSS